MCSRKRASPTRCRVGRVSLYFHHGAWWLYYRDGGKPVRRRVAQTREEAEPVAAQVNAQLTSGAPTLLAFTPINLTELRQQFLAYHENVLRSSVATVRRYRAATQHLEDFARRQPKPPQAHEFRPDAFATYLRAVEIAPNGHPNTAHRRLRDKGVQFILETCRAMYSFAGRRRHLPPYAGNPFAELPLDRLKIEDAKPIFVFDSNTEMAFFEAAVRWAFPIHFARGMWRDAGALKADAIRNSFIRIMRSIDHPEASCPKSWRHSFATLLQDANVDPLIRQLTLGHRPTTRDGLGMTAHYTHTRPETQRQQIEAALRRWPQSLAFARAFGQGGK
jgi:hypothetical protein